MSRNLNLESPHFGPKQFSSVTEIERSIEKLKARIIELKKFQLRICIVEKGNLPTGPIHFNDPEVTSTTSAIKDTILDIFGTSSPQWKRFQHFQNWRGQKAINMNDGYKQKCFESGISYAIEQLQGELNMLEEKKIDFLTSENTVGLPGHSVTLMPVAESTLRNRDGVCFVICPIGNEDSEERRRSDNILEHIISPVMKEFNFEVIRADKLHDPGKITDQILSYLYSADLVIADLTDHNANVFYELGVRHAIGKPVIQMIQNGETIPFDVHAIRTVSYGLQVDVAENSRNILREKVKWLMSNPFKPLITPLNMIPNNATDGATSKEELKRELMVEAAEENQQIAAMLSGSFDTLAEMTEEQRQRIKRTLRR